MVLAFIHPEDAHVLGMVPEDSCSCGHPTQVHKQSPCGLVGARMEKCGDYRSKQEVLRQTGIRETYLEEVVSELSPRG